ncbi:CIA30 family protein [Hirschia maritima]|uniref:CIA30 family protein n=1 Tax=Hirschia maritima TaxID=1121961 RepID=UPI000368C314|nr:CIA30 family protein [Hirschia maritima]
MIRNIAPISLSVLAVGLASLVFLLPTTESEVGTKVESSEEKLNSSLYIENVRLAQSGKLGAPTNLLIENGIIIGIGSEIEAGGLEVFDGQGHTVLAGLIDSHTHSFGSALSDGVRFGVTTHIDMFSDSSVLTQAKLDREDVSSRNKTDLYSAGMMATSPGGHGTQYGVHIETIETVDQVPSWVKARIAEGSDFLKLVYMPEQDWVTSLDREIARAIIEEGHARGLKVLAHINTDIEARHMIEDGIDGLVHIFGNKVADDVLVELAKEKEVFIIPTLSVIASVANEKVGHTFDETLLSPMQRQTLNAGFGVDIPGFSLENALESVKLFHDAGVPIIAGSDAPNPGTAHGVSLHQEMELLVRAGISEADVIAAATSIPAVIFELEGRGELQQGSRADFVLIDGNPFENITFSQNISSVFKNGKIVERKVTKEKAGSALGPTIISDFEEGMNTSESFIWSTTTDEMAGGASTASLSESVEEDGNKTLQVDMQNNAGFPYPWAGASVFAKEGPVDLSGINSLVFEVKGTQGQYRTMAFSGNTRGVPPTLTFIATEEWSTIRLGLTEFEGLELNNVNGFAIVSGHGIGKTQLYIDNIRLEE